MCSFVKTPGAKVVFLIVLLFVAWTELNRAEDLYVIERDNLYGYSEKSGDLAIVARYSAVRSFSEGLAPVYQTGSWGFIDAEGKMKIEI